MAKGKKTLQSSDAELSSAKIEAMRIRFRRVLGEAVQPHVIKQVRKNIAKLTKARSVEKLEKKHA